MQTSVHTLTRAHTQTHIFTHTNLCSHAHLLTQTRIHSHSSVFTCSHKHLYSHIFTRSQGEDPPQLSNQSTASKKYFLCIHFCATCIMGLLCWSNEKLSKKKGPGFCQALYWLHLPWNSVLLGDKHLHWPSWWPWEKPWAERLEQGSDQLVMAAVVLDPSQGPGVWSDR